MATAFHELEVNRFHHIIIALPPLKTWSQLMFTFLSSRFLATIWRPDTYFLHGRSFSIFLTQMICVLTPTGVRFDYHVLISKNPFPFPGMDAMGHLFPWWRALPSLKPLLNKKNLDVFFKNDWNSVATQLCDNVIKDSILMYNWYEIYVYTNRRCLLREIRSSCQCRPVHVKIVHCMQCMAPIAIDG